MKLSRVNNLLLGAIVAVNLYVIVAPLLPAVTFWWQGRGGTRQSELQAKVAAPVAANIEPAANALIIPGMLLDEPILEGAKRNMYAVLEKGIWHWPAGSSPDAGGNTVLLGHRFTYTDPQGSLYHLDKVARGDSIGVRWNNKQYVYKVQSIATVAPDATRILAPTEKPTLTIYTCAPLWKPVNRLVVTATLEKTL